METKEKHPLRSINFGVIPITVYRGIILERLIGGYKLFGKTCITEKEVDEIIDASLVSLENSIVNPVK